MTILYALSVAALINILPAYAMNQPSSSSSSASVSSAPEEKKLLDDQALLTHPLGRKARFFTDFPEVANALYPELKTKIAKLITRITYRYIESRQEIQAIAFSPDGTRIAILIYRETTVINAFTGKCICKGSGSIDQFGVLCWNPDGTLIAINWQIFDAQTGKSVHYFSGYHAFIVVSWSPDGSKIATADEDNMIYIFDAHTYAKLQKYPDAFKSDSFDNRSLIWSHDGQSLAVAPCNYYPRKYSSEPAIVCTKNRLFATTHNDSTHIFDSKEGEDKVGEYSLAFCELLHAFKIAHDDTEKLAREMSLAGPEHQVARIHANDAQWKTWKELEALLPKRAVKRLERYIVKAVEENENLNKYETAEKHD